MAPLFNYFNIKSFVKRNVDFCSHFFVLLLALISTPYLIQIDFFRDCFYAINSISQTLVNGNYLTLFVIDFSMSIIPLLIIFLFGLSLVGFTFSYINIFLIGAFIGNVSAYNYSEFGFHGVYQCLVSIFPMTCLLLIVYLFAIRESFVFSRMICKAFLPDKTFNYYHDFKIYCFRFLIFVLAILGISILSILKIHILK